MIKKLEINNFRGFKKLSIDLSQITLISGKNNAGKTSVLESLFLLHDYLSPSIFFKLNKWRTHQNFDFSPKQTWELLFNNFDFQKKLQISVSGSENLKLILQKTNLKENIDGRSYFLGYEFFAADKKSSGNYFIENKNFIRNSSTPDLENSKIRYDSCRVNFNENDMASIFGQIELNGKKKNLIEAIQLLDNSIIDLKLIMLENTPYIFAITKNNENYPLRIMGDGINRLLYLILAMFDAKLVLIDEIEYGFHYSFYGKLWQIITKIAEEENCQLVITTHNYEIIEEAAHLFFNQNDIKNFFSYLRLQKNENSECDVKTYSSELLTAAIESGLEIR